MIGTTISNPLIKIGYAVLSVLARKPALTDAFEIEELDAAADYITDKYTAKGAWRNFLAGGVFPNSGFAQYSYDKPHLEHKKYEYAEQVLRGYRDDTPILEDQRCVFCGRPAVFIATREHIPLLNAQGYGNFGGLGQAGLPVCGTCLLAAHALPLGCQIISGHLLALVSDDDAITYGLAVIAVREMRATLQMEGLEKMPKKRFVRTRLVETLIEAQTRGERLRDLKGHNNSLTGYLFSNSGQNAEIEILELPSDVVDFLIAIKRQDQAAQRAWEWAIKRGWEQHKTQKQEEEEAQQKNKLYEDLFTLPDQAFAFLRKHILPTQSWELTRFFLQKVMHMDPKTIDLLFDLGTRFAVYEREKSGFFIQFMREQNYTKWRERLVEASYDSMRRFQQPLVTAEEFLRAFTKPPDADKYWSWKLPRDIVTLRILEEKVKAGEELPDVEFGATASSDSDDEDENE